MVKLIDNNKAVEISIREWDEENTQYGPDWSADFYEVGTLRPVPDLSDYSDAELTDMGLPTRENLHLNDLLDETGHLIDGFDSDGDAYAVYDVDYCIEQANDMVAGIGDFAADGPQPNQFVDVTELDRSADLRGANLAGAAAGVWSMIRDKRTEPTKSPTTASRTGTH